MVTERISEYSNWSVQPVTNSLPHTRGCYFPVIILSTLNISWKWVECAPSRAAPALSIHLNALFVFSCVFYKPKTLELLKEGSGKVRATVGSAPMHIHMVIWSAKHKYRVSRQEDRPVVILNFFWSRSHMQKTFPRCTCSYRTLPEAGGAAMSIVWPLKRMLAAKANGDPAVCLYWSLLWWGHYWSVGRVYLYVEIPGSLVTHGRVLSRFLSRQRISPTE